ncbi:hypothetical protein F4680DRAFT_471295 [Xylaria scruposa]|nr:hypothetical protein F4680DRAFT_471295 [Xylaria scruposa]
MTATANQTKSRGLPDPYYVFRVFTCFGFITQWVVMIMNGSFIAMLLTNWKGVFPTGTPVKTSWTGIWPVDFMLGLLVVFFGAVNNLSDLPDIGPFLMLTDLVFTLVVFNMMTLIEDRRNRKTGSLRHPAFWQFLWNWCGAASVLPVYSYLYLKKRSGTIPPLPVDQMRALPATALWSLFISLPILLPAVLGSTSFQIQDAVLVWFFGPLTLGLFQDFAASLVSRYSYTGATSPVTLAYGVVGAVSAVVHTGVAIGVYLTEGISWSRVYWPNHGAVQPGPLHMTEGAMLFMQYDHVVIYLCVLGLGAYLLELEKVFTFESSAEGRRAEGRMLTLIVLTAVAGPGAGLAWLLCQREKDTNKLKGVVTE